MVWFYQEYRPQRTARINGFQSHYGLILSICERESGFTFWCTFNPTMVWFYLKGKTGTQRWKYCLSIPLWSDFILFLSISNCPPDASFQSHYGLILSRTNLDFWTPSTFLSIPLWSDFISLLTWTGRNTGSPFNPTMVWFYPKKRRW